MSTSTPDNYSVQEAAEFWNVHPDTIRRAINSGDLQAFKVGRVIRIPAAALQGFATPAAPWASNNAA